MIRRFSVASVALAVLALASIASGKGKAKKPMTTPAPSGDGYCGFGKVVKGMDVVDKIRVVPTGIQGGMQDVPTTPVVITMIRRIK